jgi:hypothetical protein
MLIHNTRGNYHFLPGGAAFSGAVVADNGYGIVHVTLLRPLPVVQGFAFIASHLQAQGRPVHAVCSIELRSPRRMALAEFGEFNNGTYLPTLNKYDLLVDGAGPMTRSNLAVELDPPAEPSVYAFGYTAPPADGGAPDFCLSGAADMKGSVIVRGGETSPDAMRDKAQYVMAELAERLKTLGRNWAECTAFNVYTVYDISPFLRELILEPLGAAQLQGVRWYFTRPPIEGLEFEADARRTRREVILDN